MAPALYNHRMLIKILEHSFSRNLIADSNVLKNCSGMEIGPPAYVEMISRSLTQDVSNRGLEKVLTLLATAVYK